MIILAIDPGTTKSAYVFYDSDTKVVSDFGILVNEEMMEFIIDPEFTNDCEYMVIEMIACYGMPVGKEIFETCVWIGRFIEKWGSITWDRIYRKEVTMHLCNSVKAKDSNVRQAIIDRYPATGGGKKPQIGTKKEPGPLYGVSKDVWAALGVAITFCETKIKGI